MQSIVVFLSDLIISSKVEICAKKLGFVFIDLPSENRFSSIFENEATNGSVSHARLTNDYLSGRDGALIDLLSSNNPALVIFDLDDRVIPWNRFNDHNHFIPSNPQNSYHWFWSACETSDFESWHAIRCGCYLSSITIYLKNV